MNRAGRHFYTLALMAFLAAAAAGGFTAMAGQATLCVKWLATRPEDEGYFLQGVFAGMIALVRDRVPPEDGLLLRSQADPALIPYYLFPRRVYQERTEPETSSFYMNENLSPYPVRAETDLPVKWVATLSFREGGLEANLKRAGEDGP